MKILELRMFRAVMSRLAADRRGNFGFLTALLIPVLLLIAGGAIDVARAFAEKERLQGLTDAAVMAAALVLGLRLHDPRRKGSGACLT